MCIYQQHTQNIHICHPDNRPKFKGFIRSIVTWVTIVVSKNTCSSAIKRVIQYLICQTYIKSEWGRRDRGKEHPLARKAADTSPFDYCCQVTKNIQKSKSYFQTSLKQNNQRYRKSRHRQLVKCDCFLLLLKKRIIHQQHQKLQSWFRFVKFEET